MKDRIMNMEKGGGENMARQFHIKDKDMTPEERKANELHGKKHGLIAKMNRQEAEWKNTKEKMLEDSDPEYAALKKELSAIEARQSELRLMKRKLEYDAMPEKQKRILDKLGMNPYKKQLTHRSTGAFVKTGSYTIEDKEDL